MAWIRTGTVAVTNGSTTVVGTGTAWRAEDVIGQGFDGPDGRTYEIIDTPANGQMTLATPYLGSTASGQPYQIQPFRGRDIAISALVGELVNSFSNVRDGIGAGLFPDGNFVGPALRFASDQDTGIYRAGNNALAISTGGQTRVIVDDTGNVQISPGPNTQRLNVIGGIRFGAGGTAWLTDAFVSSAGFTSFVLGSTYFNGSNYVTPNAGSNFVNTVMGQSGRILFCCASSTGASERIESPTQMANHQKFVISFDGTVSPGADNTQNLGWALARWSTVFAGTGTINTSDEREKHWRGALNAAELRAAKRIIAELGIYQWNDAVAEKGEDGARLHFGVRAQRAFTIMEDEGLDWRRYAWCCHDEWAERIEPIYEQAEGPGGQQIMRDTGHTRIVAAAGDRYGIRPDQLAFWLIAAQAAIQADLEARLAALEAA